MKYATAAFRPQRLAASVDVEEYLSEAHAAAGANTC